MMVDMSQNINEIFNDECLNHIRYILKSEFRVGLIFSLYKSSKNLDELREDLNKPSTNIFKGLKDLKKYNLIWKNDKNYSLSFTGYFLALNLLNYYENWIVINSNKNFWNVHSIDGLPEKFLLNMSFWDGAELIESDNVNFEKPLNEYLKNISNSKNIKILLPIFSKIVIDTIKSVIIKNEGIVEIITTEEILESFYKCEYCSAFNNYIKQGKLKIFLINEDISLFLTCADNFASLLLFFKDDGFFDDSSMLILHDISKIESINMLLDYYRLKSTKL